MEMVLFIGIQASGKTSFYRERFFRTHVRLNLDMLKTRRREQLLIDACLAGKTRFVVENTNLTRQGRAAYIAAAKGAGFRVIGYFFETLAADAVRRNAQRAEAERVPPVGIYAASKRLESPARDEGFDELYRVELKEGGGFSVAEF